MKLSERNARIAEILGFIEYSTGENEHSWGYPPEYGFLVNRGPMREVPDFVGIIEKWAADCREKQLKEYEERMKDVPKVDYDGKDAVM